MASLLPNGKQQFIDGNGSPLAGGSVFFYIPNTSTPKNTWQDSGQTILNTNPVILNASGEAVIYGSGVYRQVVEDINGNLIWDQLTGEGGGDPSSDEVTATGTTTPRTLGDRFSTPVSVMDFGAIPDCKKVTDIVFTSGQNTATSATANWTDTNIGNSIKAYDVINNAYPFRGTIIGVTSPTEVVLSGNATATTIAGNAIAAFGTDNAATIQAAATHAGTLVATDNNGINFPPGRGRILLQFPIDVENGDAYIFDTTLNLPPNVIIDADAMLFSNVGNGLSDRAWAITSPYSPPGGIHKLRMEVLGGMGVQLGITGDIANIYMDNIELWNVGTNFNGALTPNAQEGLECSGFDFFVNTRLWIKGGNVGLHLNQASDVFIANSELIGCATAIQYTSVENSTITAVCDTGSFEGAAIDGSRNAVLNMRCISNASTVLTYAVATGQYDSTNENRAITVNLQAQRTGGIGLLLNYTQDSVFNANLSNALTYSGAGGNITQAVQYGTGNIGNIVVNIYRDSSSITTLSSGANPGLLLDYADGVLQVNGQSLGASPTGGSSLALTSLVTSTTQNTIVAKELVLENGAGGVFRATNVNVSYNTATVGIDGIDTGAIAANQWYYEYVAYNPTTATLGAFISLLNPSTHIPAGYTFYKATGEVRTDGSAHLIGKIQAGSNVQYTPGVNLANLPIIISGSTGSVVTAAAVANFVPPTASAIDLAVNGTISNTQDFGVAPNANYTYLTSADTDFPITLSQGYTNPTAVGGTGRYLLESGNVYFASNGSGCWLRALGWKTNLING